MRQRVLKDMLKQRQVPIGCWQFILHPDITDIIGESGFDFVLLDTEHSSGTIEAVGRCILAADAAGMPTVVRVAEKGQQFLIEQALDAGAQGVLVPMVETKEEAARMVTASRFHPEGERGWCPLTRAGRWGTQDDFIAASNRDVLVAGIVESPKGFDRLDDLLSVDGVDAWMPGPGDLSVRLGLTLADPVVVERMEDAVRAISASGKSPWLAVSTAEDIEHARRSGARMTCVATDAGQLIASLQSIRAGIADAMKKRD